jgi:Fe-S-cluster containining protein
LASEQDCIQCGRCCERWGWGQKGVIEDIIPWLAANRLDILRHVSVLLSSGRQTTGDCISPEDLLQVREIRYWRGRNSREMRKCPFFRRSGDGKAWCGIHALKPRVCREFTPWNWKNLEYAGNCPACREKMP